MTSIFSCSAMRCRMKFVFKRCAASAARAFDQLLLLCPSAIRPELRARDFAAPTRSARAAFRCVNKRRRQIETASVRAETSRSALPSRARPRVPFRARDCAQSCAANRPAFFPAELRRERIIQRRQDLFLDFVQRHRVIRLLSRQLRHRKIRREIRPEQLRVSPGFMPDELLAKFRQKILRREIAARIFFRRADSCSPPAQVR